MGFHAEQQNKDEACQPRSGKRQQQQLLGVNVSSTSESTSSSPSTSSTPASSISISITDPPPPYALSRSHSSDDVTVNTNTNTNNNIANTNFNTSTTATNSFRYAPQPSNLVTLSGTTTVFPVSISAPGSGTATPRVAPVSIPFAIDALTGTSASGVSLRKSSSSVDDLIWTDMRRRRRHKANFPNGYDLRVYHQKDEDEVFQNTITNEYGDEELANNEDFCIYTSPDNDHGRDHTNFRPISTGSRAGMGETETEMDEPPRRLPTSRKITPPLTEQHVTQLMLTSGSSLLDFISGPSPSSPLSHDPSMPLFLVKLSQSRFTPILFELFKLLSIVPAGLGFIWHLWCFGCALWPGNDTSLGRIGTEFAEIAEFKMTVHTPFDHFVCLLWTLLTAHQCLALTTGLQLRWRAYYPSHATLIRLLALQAICWPATQFTLVIVNHELRPVICWALIGSTTCFSRAVQIWVVSNLKVIRHGMKLGVVNSGRGKGRSRTRPAVFGLEGTGENRRGTPSLNPDTNSDPNNVPNPDLRDGAVTIRWVPRRWDWPLVIRTCVIPAAIVYFVMAWVGELRREVERWSQ